MAGSARLGSRTTLLVILGAALVLVDPTRACAQTASETAQATASEVGAIRAEARSGAAAALRRRIDEGGAVPVARVIAETEDIPTGSLLRLEALAPLFGEALAESDREERGVLVGALARFQSRDAVRPLIELLTADVERRRSDAVIEALMSQTGREDLGLDVDAWRRWWAEAQHLPESEWRRRISAAQAARAARASARLDAAQRRRAETARRLYLALDHSSRSALLVQFMQDEAGPMRALAFDLAERELLNARPVGEAVIEAAITRLRDEDAAVRAAAASLLAKTAAARAASASATALRAEMDAEAAARMLELLERAPARAAVKPAIAWLGADSGARGSAASFLVSAAGRGLVVDPSMRGSILEALRARPAETLKPDEIRLFGRLGAEADRERIAGLLELGAEDQAIACVEALSLDPEHVAALVGAARARPALAPQTIEALVTWRPDMSGFREARELAALSDTDGRGLLLRFMESLPPEQLLRAARRIESPETRLAALERVEALATAHGGRPPSVVRALVLDLAEARLGVGDGAGALDALDRLAPPSARAARVRALVRLNRIEEAVALGASASVWLDALEECVREGRSHSKSVQELISAQMRDELSTDELARLESLSERLKGDKSADAESSHDGVNAADEADSFSDDGASPS